MKERIKTTIVGFLGFCITYYLLEFILYKTGVESSFSIEISTIVGFFIGWTLAELIIFKVEKKRKK